MPCEYQGGGVCPRCERTRERCPDNPVVSEPEQGPWVTPRSFAMVTDMLRPTVTLDPGEYKRQPYPGAEHVQAMLDRTSAKWDRLWNDYFSIEPQTFDGEKGTYSDPKCALCPWEKT